ncbi:MAG: PKD domain-containing protein, partial [Bacteroidota bacterium]
TDVFGNIVSWNWFFGPNLGTSDQQNPSFTFDTVGVFDLHFTVRDDWGCVNTLILDDVIDVTFPIAAFEADTFSCTEYRISFDNQSTGKDLIYRWDFGDGQISTLANPEHTYTIEGVYDVCLTVTDLYGCDSTLCRQDYITIANPVAAFTSDTTSAACPPLLVNFENQSQNASSFEWDFGDESGLSDLENPPHIYTIPGRYEVTLIASSIQNCRDTVVLSDYITLDGPLGDFSFDIDSSCVPAEITFSGASDGPYSYIWDYGNGDLDTTVFVQADTLAYTYDEIGHFVPKLILVNSQGCSRALESPDTINLGRLDIDFMATDTALCGTANSTFFNTTVSSAPILFQQWDFPGGSPNSSQAFEPTVTYDSAGLFDVRLIVGNAFCQDTLTRVNLIGIGDNPVAEFEPSTYTECEPASIGFTDLSTVNGSIITEWDWDFGDGANSVASQPSHRFEQAGTYTVQLNVKSEVGCENSIEKEITIHEKPETALSTGNSICMGQLAQLQALILTDTTGGTFAWNASTDLSCTNCLDPLAGPMDTTTYTFIATNSFGCADTNSIRVDVRPFPAPVVDLTADTTICANEIIQLTATGGNTVYDYNWDTNRPGLDCYEHCFNPIATPLATTTYIITVTNEFDCYTIDSVEVAVVSQEEDFLGADRIICEGDTAMLNAGFGINPQWIVFDGLSCINCPNPVAMPDSSMTYLVRVETPDMGCEIFDSVRVEVMYDSEIDAGEDQSICLGESTILNGLVPRGTVLWSPSVGLDNVAATQPEAAPVAATTYFMQVTNGDCVLTDSVQVGVQEQTEIDAEDVTICEGESVEIMANGEASSFNWSPGTAMNNSRIRNPIVSPTETLTYTVTGQLGTCAPDEATVTVNVIPSPDIYLTPQRFFYPGQKVDLNIDEINENYTYNWFPDLGLSCSTCPRPFVVPERSSNYSVEVIDMESGCVDTFSTEVNLLEHCPDDIMSVPNIFTPNGDGNNDVLRLHISPSIAEIKSFKIFNRWGEMVYATADIQDFWDGNINGKPAQNGVYVYLLEVPCEIKGTVIMKSGDITLLR